MTTSIERKPIEYYLDLKYPVTFETAQEGGYFVEIEDLPGCYSQGETIEEAMKMIEEARRLWIEVAYEDDLNIPLPRGGQEYSGKFFIRTPKSLHRELVKMAKREGVSLNQLLVATLSRVVGANEKPNVQKKKRTK